MDTQDTLARQLAPDDVRPDDYVAILSQVNEYVVWHCERVVPDVEVHRAVTMSDGDDCLALRVVDVCLPYVFVKQPDGVLKMLDTRRYRLAKLSPRFGRTVFKRIKAKAARDKDGGKAMLGEE